MNIVDISYHKIQMVGRIATEEEARAAYEAGKTAFAFWSDYPETGMAWAGQAMSKSYGEGFDGDRIEKRRAVTHWTIKDDEQTA
ncbi:hypothetical protein [Tumebacillus flagellatus]|uniref:Uncharacterized protein n=1 Tax=Tumebacillus flagellatus TaxID=1157490 RepID=A0A074LJT7_9BACL|nr:hypothetical protein [Tumebacillus flagellatus]KEO80870.1 hypothetical protein EL26_23930 [Tumebacillus flagellatus]